MPTIRIEMFEGRDIVPIPGTKRRGYLEENAGALGLRFSADELARIDAVFPSDAATGERYAAPMMMGLLNR